MILQLNILENLHKITNQCGCLFYIQITPLLGGVIAQILSHCLCGLSLSFFLIILIVLTLLPFFLLNFIITKKELFISITKVWIEDGYPVDVIKYEEQN